MNKIRYYGLAIAVAIFSLFFIQASVTATSSQSEQATQHPFIVSQQNNFASYTKPDAAAFAFTVKEFRKSYNTQNPHYAIPEYHQINNKDPNTNVIRAASKINNYLYSSAALEKKSGKIKSLQFTFLPVKHDPQKNNTYYQISLHYMASAICWFDTLQSNPQCLQSITDFIFAGKGQLFYQKTEGSLRYVISDEGQNGLTFAIEPITLLFSE